MGIESGPIRRRHAILMGGHVRIGLEDNIYYRKGELAPNERFVERMVKLAAEFGRAAAVKSDVASAGE